MQVVLISSEDLAYLENLAADVVQASRIEAGEMISGSSMGLNQTGGTLVRPGGRACYPAFWIRDFAMSLESGLISLDEQEHALILTATHQQDGAMMVPSGSFVPDGSIPDHITLSNRPIYFPGTLDDAHLQGGRWGELPALDDHFYFIHIAWQFVMSSGRGEILSRDVNGVSLFDRLERAFRAVPSDDESGVVCCTEDLRGVSFGFCDSVFQTGALLFCSILKYQSALEMTELSKKYCNDPGKAMWYKAMADRLRRNIPRVFGMKRGLFEATTGLSAQPDVWGSAYGVYINLFDKKVADEISLALREAYLNQTISHRGYIRHVRTTDDHSQSTAWEQCINGSQTFPKNEYQNGAYWATPTGWVCYAIARVDSQAASKLAKDYIQNLREEDFRHGETCGAPWECLHPDGNHKRNPVYMTSITCPLPALKKCSNMV